MVVASSPEHGRGAMWASVVAMRGLKSCSSCAQGLVALRCIYPEPVYPALAGRLKHQGSPIGFLLSCLGFKFPCSAFLPCSHFPYSILALLPNLGTLKLLLWWILDWIVQGDIFLYLLERVNDSYLDFVRWFQYWIYLFWVCSLCMFFLLGHLVLSLGMLTDFFLNTEHCI